MIEVRVLYYTLKNKQF